MGQTGISRAIPEFDIHDAMDSSLGYKLQKDAKRARNCIITSKNKKFRLRPAISEEKNINYDTLIGINWGKLGISRTIPEFYIHDRLKLGPQNDAK